MPATLSALTTGRLDGGVSGIISLCPSLMDSRKTTTSRVYKPALCWIGYRLRCSDAANVLRKHSASSWADAPLSHPPPGLRSEAMFKTATRAAVGVLRRSGEPATDLRCPRISPSAE